MSAPKQERSDRSLAERGGSGEFAGKFCISALAYVRGPFHARAKADPDLDVLRSTLTAYTLIEYPHLVSGVSWVSSRR